MLPSRYQLPTHEILPVLQRGIRINHDMLQLRYIKTTKAPSRLGILVGKMYDKKAVVRNRVKRQLAMAFLPYLKSDLHPKDIVCKIGKTSVPLTFEEIKNAIDTFFTHTL